MFYDQEEYSVRFAWGREGLQALGPAADLNVSNAAPCLHGNAYAAGIPRSADIWDRL